MRFLVPNDKSVKLQQSQQLKIEFDDFTIFYCFRKDSYVSHNGNVKYFLIITHKTFLKKILISILIE